MSAHKDTVERYFDGFRRSDHAAVLACLTDDVVWDLPGYKHLTGKDAFDAEIEGADFVGSPTLTVDRLVEEDGTVVAIGDGAGTHVTGRRPTASPSAPCSRSATMRSAESSRTSFR